MLWLLKKSNVNDFKNTTHSQLENTRALSVISETIDETISFEAFVS